MNNISLSFLSILKFPLYSRDFLPYQFQITKKHRRTMVLKDRIHNKENYIGNTPHSFKQIPYSTYSHTNDDCFHIMKFPDSQLHISMTFISYVYDVYKMIRRMKKFDTFSFKCATEYEVGFRC